MTIAQVLEASLPDDLKGHSNVVVYNKGVRITHPENYYFNTGDRLSIYLVPEGGGGNKGGAKGIIGMIIGVILIIVTWGFAAIGVAGITGLTAVGQGVALMGASLAIGGLASIISPPPSLSTNSSKTGDSSYYAISGQSNTARFYQNVIKLYGRHKMFPSLATQPRIDSIGSRSTISALYDWGIGLVQINDLKIGETLINAYTNDVVHHLNTRDFDLKFTGFKSHQDRLALETKKDVAHTVRTIPNTYAADIEITFPFGMVATNDKGEDFASGADFRIRYRQIIQGAAPPGTTVPNLPVTGKDHMDMDDTLWSGQELVSPNRWYKLAMSPDGNLVVIDKAGTATWATGTEGNPEARLYYGGPPKTAYPPLPNFTPGRSQVPVNTTLHLGDELVSPNGWFKLVIGTDGNVIIVTKAAKGLWATGTEGNPGARLVYMSAPGTVVTPPNVPSSDFPTIPPRPNKLDPGDTLQPGQWLQSANNWYRAGMQTDGNLVVHSKSNEVIWTSKTNGNPGARAVHFNSGAPAGVFAVISTDNRILWQCPKKGTGGVVIGNDGNLNLLDSSGAVVWNCNYSTATEPSQPPAPPVPPPPANLPTGAGNSVNYGETLYAGTTRVSSNGWYVFTVGHDGNVTVFDKTGKGLWATGTEGNPGARFVFDWEYNISVMSPTHQVLWRRGPFPGAQSLIMQDHGNLVLQQNGNILWNTQTYRPSEPRSLQGSDNVAQPFGAFPEQYVTSSIDQPFLENPNGGAAAFSARKASEAGGLYVFSADNRVLWHRYAPQGTLNLQNDGQLVIYDNALNPVWVSGVFTHTEPTLVPSIDPKDYGSLRVYSKDNRVLWDVGGIYGGRLYLQNDGQLTIRNTINNDVLWASGSWSNDEPTYFDTPGTWRLIHKNMIGGISTSYIGGGPPAGFNARWYVATYPEVANDPVYRQQPYKHYLEIGKAKGYQPGPPSSSTIRLFALTKKPVVAVVHFDFPHPGLWEIEILRLSQVADGQKEVNAATITLIESNTPGNVLNLPAPHTMTEMRVLATGKLSGVVQNLSATCTSVLNYYDDFGRVVGWAPTRNPAWICIDILTGPSNPRPAPAHMIDWPAWRHLADYCDELRTWNINGQTITAARHTCDVVVDYVTTVKELVNSVLSGCRAMLTISLDGKYSVAIDRERTIPRQLITTANSWDFSGMRQFAGELHGVRVSFLDSRSNYQKQEIVAYADGYNENTAVKIEDLGTFGITDFWQAWAFGRYHLACVIHRSEVFTMKMDVENLAFSRGDLVSVAHDVPQVGGIPCKVADVVGNTVTVNEVLSTTPQGYSVRLQDGTIRQGDVLSVPDAGKVELDNATGILPDDLIIFGEPFKVTKNYLVQSIAPQADLVAEITLVPYVREIYDADIGVIPPWDAGISNAGDFISRTDLAAKDLTADQTLIYIERRPFIRFHLKWAVTGTAYGYSEIYMSTAEAESIHIGSSDSRRTEFFYDLDVLKNRILINHPITFEVIPISSSGLIGSDDETVVRPI
jgi:predicted phage tail protein